MGAKADANNMTKPNAAYGHEVKIAKVDEIFQIPVKAAAQ